MATNLTRIGVRAKKERKLVFTSLYHHVCDVDNINWCDRYIYYATRILFKWINRKSQRRAYNWEQFRDALAYVGWPKADIRKNLNPYRV